MQNLSSKHKALEHEIAEALAHSSTDDLKITELKRRKLILKDEIERVRHDHAL
ncbi:MAG: YdcH family protein [Halobacteriota archaeon]